MNTSSEAAEQVVRLSLEGFEVAAKITGSGAKGIAVLLYTIMKDKHKTAGKTTLTNMLKSGKELKVFSVKADEFKRFTEEAKRYGVLYSALINKKTKSHDGVIDIMVRAEDAAKINRIVERFKLSSYEEASIRSEIKKTREEKNKGKEPKNKEDIIKEQESEKSMKKEEQSLNPHSAKTEKSPLSKPSSKTQKTSDQGSRIKKPSVKEKLSEAKEIVKARDNESKKSEVIKSNEHSNTPKKKKNKEKSL